jgi:hypothetical protein
MMLCIALQEKGHTNVSDLSGRGFTFALGDPYLGTGRGRTRHHAPARLESSPPSRCSIGRKSGAAARRRILRDDLRVENECPPAPELIKKTPMITEGIVFQFD